MKRMWSLLALSLLLASNVLAQAERGGQDKEEPGTRVNQPDKTQPAQPSQDILTPSVLATRLNLTSEQRPRIDGLWNEYRDRNERIKRDSALTSEQKIQRLNQSRQEYINLIRSVLKEDQLKKFEELLKSDGRPAGSTVDPSMQISPQQREKIMEITRRYNQIRQQVMQDTSLDAQAKQKRLQEVNQQMLQEIRGTLTPEQRQKMDANKPKEQPKEQPKEAKDEKKDEKKDGDKGDKEKP